jgi:Fe-S cluster biosynthesis and repair protein YggX
MPNMSLASVQDLKDIQDTLEAAKAYGDSVVAQSSGLRSHFKNVAANVRKELKSLSQSRDFHMVVSKLEQYSELPEELQQELQQVQQHRDELLEYAKQEIAELSAASNPQVIDRQLEKFEILGDVVDSERIAAVARKTELLERASKEMEMLATSPDTSLREIETCLTLYEDYPRDVRKARDQLKTRQAVLSARLREKIRDASATKSFKDIAALLDDIGDSAGDKLAGPVVDLRNQHQNLVIAMQAKLKAAMGYKDARAVQQLLDDSAEFGTSVKSEVTLVERRLSKLISDVNSKLNKLTKVDDLDVVNTALAQYEDYPSDTKASWEALQTHREALTARAKQALSDCASSEDPTKILAVIEQYGKYDQMVASEREDAQARYFDLMDSARTELLGATEDPDVDIPKLSELVKTYEGYPREISELRQQLRTKITRAVSAGGDAVVAALRSTDVAAVDTVLAKFGGVHDNFQDQLEDLRVHRQRLLRDMVSAMTAAMSMTDPRLISQVLRDSEPFGSEVSTERSLLEERRASMRTVAIEEINLAIKSDDLKTIDAALLRYEDFPDEVRAHWETLQQVKEDMIDIAKATCRDLLSAKNPRDIDAAMPSFEQFGDHLRAERQALFDAREELVGDIQSQLTSATSEPIEEMERVLFKYVEYDDEDIGRQRKRLEAALRSRVALMEERMLQLKRSRDIKAVDETLKANSAYEDRLPDAFLELRRHRDKLIESVCEQLMAAVDLSDPVRIKEILHESEPFADEVQREREALQDRYENILQSVNDDLENLLRTTDYASVQAALKRHHDFPVQLSSIMGALEIHAGDLVAQCRESLKEACLSSDLAEIDKALANSHAFGPDVQDMRKEAESRRDEIFEIAAADMDSWVKDPMAQPWLMSEVLQKYPSTQYREDSDARVARARSELQDKLSRTISHLENDFRALITSDNIAEINTMLVKHKKDKEMIPEAYRQLQQRRQQLGSSLHVRLNEAMGSSDISLISKFAIEASKAGLTTEKLALDEKRAAIVADVTRELEDLSRADDYTAIAEAVVKYEAYADELGPGLVQLQERARSMQEEARTYLREQSTKSADPVHLSEIIAKYEVFGEPVADMLHAVKIRRLNLIEAARRDLQSMCYRPNLTVPLAEEAITKYEAFGEDFGAAIQALRARIEGLVDDVAIEAMATRHSDNLAMVDTALAQAEELLSRYQPDTLSELRLFRAEMLSTMQSKVESALLSDDPRQCVRMLTYIQDNGFSSVAQKEVEQLHQKVEERVQVIDQEIKDSLQTDDYPVVISTIEKYSDQGYPDAIEEAVGALQTYSEYLVRQARRRVAEAVDTLTDPQELMDVIEAHKDYEDVLSEQLANARAHRLSLFQQAKIRMQLMIQDPHASIDELSAVYSQFSEYSFEVRTERTNLHYRIERAINDAERKLQDALVSDDVTSIEKLLQQHENSKDLLEPSYGELVAYREGLTTMMKEKMVGGVASIRDPWEVRTLLEAAAPYGEDVAAQADQLNDLYEQLIEEGIDTMHRLTEDEDFAAISDAVRKYEHYPRVARSAWQALRQHQRILLNAARQELQDASKSNDVMLVTTALARYAEYGNEIEQLVETVRERESQLHVEAEETMRTMLQSDDVSTHAISATIERFSYLKGTRVQKLLSSMHEHLAKQLRNADLRMRDALRSEDVTLVDELLSEFRDHGEELGHVVQELVHHRQELRAKMEQRLAVATASDDPRKLWSTIVSARKFGKSRMPVFLQVTGLHMHSDRRFGLPGEHVAAHRSAVEQRYAIIVENIIRHIKSLSRSQDFVAVTTALEKYTDYPPEEFAPALATLRAHHEDLTASAKKELGHLARSDDPGAIDDALERFAEYHEHVGSDIQMVRTVRNRLLESARKTMVQLANSKTSTLTAMENALEQYSQFPIELNDARRLLIDKLEATKTIKAQLATCATSADPAYINRELQRYAAYGPGVAEEQELLGKRVAEICETARIEMEDLVRDKSATMMAIERALDKYSRFPDTLADIRGSLSAKFETMLATCRHEINRQVGPADIGRVNVMLQQFSRTTNLARDVVSDLEQQQSILCEQMVLKMKDALLLDDPVTLANLIEESLAYGDHCDVVAFRNGLREQYKALLSHARADINAAMEWQDYDRVAAVLRRTERFPSEIKPEWEQLDAHRNRLIRDVVRDAQAAMGSSSTQAIDATIAQLSTFGEKFLSYKQLLHARRKKLVANSAKLMQNALQLTEVQEVDRVCSAHVHLVAEIDGALWKALRDHRQALIEKLRARVEELLQAHSIVQLDEQLEKISADGLRHELQEEIERLREHREYLTQEAEAALLRAQSVASSRNFLVVSSKLKELQQYGLGDRPEARELVERRRKLVEIARSEVVAAAASSNAHLLAATLERFSPAQGYGVEELATERRALEVCLERLQAVARDALQGVSQRSSRRPEEIKRALVVSDHFHGLLHEEREAAQAQLEEVMATAEAEMQAALVGDDYAEMQRVVQAYGECGGDDELRPLHAQVQQRLEQHVGEMRSALLGALGLGRIEEIDEVAAVLARYRQSIAGVDSVESDWDALEGHYRRLLLAGKSELASLLRDSDPARVGRRLEALKAVQHFAPEMRQLRAHARQLLRHTAAELRELARGIDAVAINLALRRYGALEEALRHEMEGLRRRLSELSGRQQQQQQQQQRGDGSTELGAGGLAPPLLLPPPPQQQQRRQQQLEGTTRSMISANDARAQIAAATQELERLLATSDVEEIDAGLARYGAHGGAAAARLGPAVVSAVAKLRTHRTVICSQAAGGAAVVEASYARLGGAGAALAQLEAAQSALQARVGQAASEAETFEKRVATEAAAARVLSMRVEQLRGELGRRQQQPGAPSSQLPSTTRGARRCPACRKPETEIRGDFKAHAMRCICRAVDFSVQRAAAGQQ